MMEMILCLLYILGAVFGMVAFGWGVYLLTEELMDIFDYMGM